MKSLSKAINWNFLFILIIVLAFVVFFKGLFWPELSIYATPDLGRSEVWSLNYPLKDLLSHALKNFDIPFWSKNIGTGYPVFAEGLIGTLYLPNLFLFGLFPTPLAWNLSYVLTFILIFAGTYLFIYKNSKNSNSAIFGALVFTFSGYNIVHIAHYPLIQSIGLLPLLIYTGQNLVEYPTKKNIFIFALLLSQQIFIGHPQVVFMTLLLLMIFAFTQLRPVKGRNIFAGLSPLITGVVFGLLFAAPQLIPSLELLPLTITGIRGLNVLSEISRFPYLPKYLLTIISPSVLGSFRNGSFPNLENGNSLYWEINGYVGLIPVIMAVYAIYKMKKSKYKIFLVFSILFSFYLCFSYIFPFKLLFLLPGFNLFRVTSRFLLIGLFPLSVMAGFGLKELSGRFKNAIVKNIFTLFLFIFSLLPLIKFGINYNPTVRFSEFLKTPEITKHITNSSRVIDDPSIYQSWNNSLKKLGLSDMTPFLFYSNAVDGFLPLTQNIPNADSEISAPLLRQSVLLKYPDYFLMGANSVDYFISTRKLPQESPLNYFGVIRSENAGIDDIYIYKNSDSLPSFRLISGYEVRPFDFKDPDWHFSKNGSNFGNTALLEVNPGIKFEKPSDTDITILTDEDRVTSLKVKTDKRSILLAAYTNYPGWTVWVNGKRTKIMAANFNQRAVVVPEGDSIITFKYFPYSFYAGVLILLAAVFLFRTVKINFR